MTSHNQKSTLDQLDPALLQDLSDEQANNLEGGVVALILLFMTPGSGQASAKSNGRLGFG